MEKAVDEEGEPFSENFGRGINKINTGGKKYCK
ncbi:hypothetical protein WBP_0568 [Wolbachia endosymbiont of Brugia pahangi]|nr:hypothetical protein WBP_0568 [Wolbachia endosymbiont of Brugia pahangi]